MNITEEDKIRYSLMANAIRFLSADAVQKAANDVSPAKKKAAN